MTDLAEIDTLSTEIDTDAGPSAGGGGQVVEPAEPASLRSDLETVFREETGKEADDAKPEDGDKEPDEKPEPAKDEKGDKEQAKEDEKPKPQRAEDGKFARTEKDDQPKEERKLVEAPSNFLPKAKEVWRNTPHAVQAEVARMVQEHQEASERVRETTERYESLRQYDDLARSNGRDLRESLERMTQVENLLQQNPIAGLNAILMEVGPRKADGQPYSLMEVAQFIAQQDPQQYQQMVRPPQEAPREDPRVVELQQQLAQVQHRQIHDTVIAPFAQAHPRFAELERDIAFFLQSDRIPTSLSPQDRLAAAYDMAERINPPSYADDTVSPQQGLATPRRADEGFSGSKSIKSSPGSVSEEFDPMAKSGESIRDSLRAEARRLNR